MDKKIMVEMNTKRNAIEIWIYNRKGFYNFKEYISLQGTNLKDLQKKYKGYRFIDKQNILAKLNTSQNQAIEAQKIASR